MEKTLKCYWISGKDGEESRCGLPAVKYVRWFGLLCCMHADEANRNYMNLAEKSVKKKSGVKKKSFIPPTLDEVRKYISDNNYHVKAEDFFSYFTAGKWIDSKGNKVKNWKQKLITWEQYKKKEKGNNGYARGGQQPLDCEAGTSTGKYSNIPAETIGVDNTRDTRED